LLLRLQRNAGVEHGEGRLFGEITHGACAYNHDLRSILFSDEVFIAQTIGCELAPWDMGRLMGKKQGVLRGYQSTSLRSIFRDSVYLVRLAKQVYCPYKR
jgi:hypothetical protein